MSERNLRLVIRELLSEDPKSDVLVLRTPGSESSSYAASNPKRIKTRRPSLGEEGAESPDEPEGGPVTVSRAFSKSDY